MTDPTCGDQLNDWVPLLGSTWTFAAVVNGQAQTGAVVMTHLGTLAVTTVTDPLLGVFHGTYEHNADAKTLTWTADDLPITGDQFKYRCAPDLCDANGKVVSAHGSVIQLSVGAVGTFTVVRVL